MRYIIACLLLLASVSCEQSEMKILTEDEVANVLVDLTISDQVISLHHVHERDSIREVLMESLLKIHDLDRAELDSNLYIYMSDFERFAKVNEVMQAKIDSLLQEEQ